MRLSAYAKQMGVSYKTAFRWWKAGKLDAYQLDTGTVIVREPAQPQERTGVALYARVSSADQKEDLERQMWRNEALTLSDRVFVCQDCGAVTDRDYNAAQNIVRVAVSSIDTQNACGQRSAGSYSGTGETALDEAGTKQHYGLSIDV